MPTNRVQPIITAPRNIDISPAEVFTSANGVKLYSINCSDEQVMRMSFVFRAGSSMQIKPFTASATANLLSEGSTEYTSQQISEKLDYYGSYFDITLDRDYVVITFCSLSKFFEQTLEMAKQILLKPAFSEQEIETYCVKRQQRLAVERSRVAFKARELFAHTLFGPEHPYGVASNEKCYEDITRDDVVELYHKLYRAENCFAVCSGTISTEITDAILELCGQIPSGEVVYPEFPEVQSQSKAFQRFEGAVQSAIRVGRRLFPRSHPDFVAMQVLTTILGGYFGSRLVQNLREERGYTYGVFAGMVNMECDGYLAIGTEVAAEATDDSLVQIFAEIERLRIELVAEDELAMVRNIMIGEMMRILDAPFGISDVTIENVSNGTDNDYINRMIAEIMAITPQRLIEVAQRYLAKDEFTTIVVADVAPSTYPF